MDDATATYPIRVLSFGAGVQSSTLLRMAIAGDIEPVQHAIFADTGWEPKGVYEHMAKMRELAEAAGIEFHIVSSGNIRNDTLDPNHRFASMPVHVVNLEGQPAMGRRQCTSEYKIKPLLAKEREIAGLKPGQRCKEHRITTLIGISLDEIQRMKDPAFPWIVNEYPLVDKRMTRHDCLMYHHKLELEKPPRSACIGCPYHSDKEWRHIRDNDPESWADAVFVDNEIRNNPAVANRLYEGRAYLHAKRIPLSVVDLSTPEDHGQLNMFGNECEGMCGL
jgi:hypothetical protein